jgi:hypothetical protein
MKTWQDLAIPEPNSGCWLWEGSLGHGFPRFHDSQVRRLACRDPLKPGMVVEPNCGNQLCVSPEHLFARPKMQYSRDWRDLAIPEPMSGCWLWEGQIDGRGYAKQIIDNKHVQVHRRAWAEVNGPIPRGMVICHRCDNKLCVNPEHLFCGTASDNMQDMSRKGRGRKATITHCHNGHEYTPENTYTTKQGHRMCKTCLRANALVFQAANRQRLNEQARLYQAERRRRLRAEAV